MSEILDGDPFGIGLTGYTREEGEAILRGEPVGGVAAQQPIVEPRDFTCENRLSFIEIGVCDLCSMKGQPFEIFGCALHGQCSLNRRHSRVKSCVACGDRIPVANADPSAVS